MWSRFSHWYHMLLQFWTFQPICGSLRNCVQWTWNCVKNKRPIYWVGFFFFFSPTCEKQFSCIWLTSPRTTPPNRPAGAYVTRWSSEGKTWAHLAGMVELSTRSYSLWSHEREGDDLNGKGVILGRGWKAQKIVLPVRVGEECAHWSPGWMDFNLELSWSKRISGY